MGVNPGDRHAVQKREQAVKGTIAFLSPILTGLLIILAFAFLTADLGLAAIAAAFLSGILGGR